MQRETTVGIAISAVLLIGFAVGFKQLRRPAPATIAPSASASVVRPPREIDALAALTIDATPIDWNKPVKSGPHREDGYVGNARCAECHKAIAAKYDKHSMSRTGVRVVGPIERATLIKAFDAGQAVKHPTSGFTYRPYRQGQKLFVEERLDGPDGTTAIHKWSQEITHTFASDTFGRALGFRNGGFVYQIPIDWYPGAGKWSIDPGFKHGGRFDRPLAATCIGCHSEAPEHLHGSFDAVTDPAPGGVGCERCHGPGKKHAESLLPVDVVNPHGLPPIRKLELCAQCHLQGTAEILRAGRTIYDARPGEPLHAYRINYVQADASEDWFQLTGQVDRLVRSPCYQKSKGNLTCTTCHDAHGTSVGTPAATWRKTCLGCHAETACKAEPAKRKAVIDNCPSCHMRKDTPGDFRMQVAGISLPTTDHWIRKTIHAPTPLDAPARAPKLVNVVPFAPLVGETPNGAELFAIEAVALQQAGKPDAIIRLVAASQAKSALPEVYDEIARVLEPSAKSPDQFEQLRLLRAAIVRRNQDDVGALVDYAKAAVLTAPPNLTEANAALDRALRVFPNHPGALLEKATLLYRAGKRAEASEIFDRAASAGPDALEAYVALALIAKETNDHKTAAQNLEEARKRDPRDRWILEQLAGAYLASGNIAAADAVGKIIPMLIAGPPSKRIQRLLTPF